MGEEIITGPMSLWNYWNLGSCCYKRLSWYGVKELFDNNKVLTRPITLDMDTVGMCCQPRLFFSKWLFF